MRFKTRTPTSSQKKTSTGLLRCWTFHRRSTKNCNAFLAGTPIYTQRGHIVPILLPPDEPRFQAARFARHGDFDAVGFVQIAHSLLLRMKGNGRGAIIWVWNRVSGDIRSNAQKSRVYLSSSDPVVFNRYCVHRGAQQQVVSRYSSFDCGFSLARTTCPLRSELSLSVTIYRVQVAQYDDTRAIVVLRTQCVSARRWWPRCTTISHVHRIRMTEPELCRLCAETKENLIGIYDVEGQKLGIESKIAKCLRIEILITDSLPLAVCMDCCALLNQCSEFFEKTNQAQVSLRQLLIDQKSETQPIESNIDYVEETVEYQKHEASNREEIVVECHLPNNYINETVNILNTSYFIEECKAENSETSEMQDNVKQKKCKLQIKKGSPKLTKKKVKRKNQILKIEEESELHISSEMDKVQNDTVVKNNMKIADNYMSEIESNLEMRETRAVEAAKHGRKKTEGLEKYDWLCTDCNDKLPSLETLEEHHETVHSQQAKYMCVQCCKVYDKYYGFLIHVKRHKNKTKFSCEDCGKSFVHKKVLDSHKTIHSEERPFVCQTCGKAFRQQSALFIHNRCHLPDTVKNKFPCDQCNKRFSTKPNLVTHKRIHSGVRNFTCDQCGKSFIQKGNLEAHFLTHSVDKPYSCSQCTKAFKTPLQLKKHETVHTGAKPHQCAVCGRTFREKGTLREHHRIHTGAMPFTCEFCGKCFRFKGILTTHRRQHTGERPYSCLECQHHFTNWPNYNKHMKRRHGINTSHTKHLTNNQQLQQQQPVEPTQSPQIQQHSPTEDPLAISQSESTTVQVIQAVPHASSTQPIVIQAIPTTSIQTFQTDVTNTVQETVFRERNATYFNAVPALQNFLPTNLPYNFYSISNVAENDLIQHR